MKTKDEQSKNECVAFGEFVKTTRIGKGIIARDAAEIAEILPSNFSKIEHGALPPPRDGDKQKLLASALRIEPGSGESEAFFDLAGRATGITPIDLAEIISEDDARPLLLRTIGNKRLTADQIKKLVDIVRELPNGNQKSQ